MLSKNLPIVVVAILTVSTGIFSKKIENEYNILKECQKSTQATDEEIHKNDILLKKPSENVLCMGKCLMEKFELTDSEGKIVKENLIEFTKEYPEILKNQMVECVDKVETIGSCDDVETYRECVLPAIEKVMNMQNGN